MLVITAPACPTLTRVINGVQTGGRSALLPRRRCLAHKVNQTHVPTRLLGPLWTTVLYVPGTPNTRARDRRVVVTSRLDGIRMRRRLDVLVLTCHSPLQTRLVFLTIPGSIHHVPNTCTNMVTRAENSGATRISRLLQLMSRVC
jgi:hypothetical protein